MLEGVPLAFGGIAPPHVFNDDDVSTRGAFQSKVNFIVLVVWCALQKHGELSINFRAIDVCLEFDAVAHGDNDVAFVGDGVVVGGVACENGTENNGGTRKQTELRPEH